MGDLSANKSPPCAEELVSGVFSLSRERNVTPTRVTISGGQPNRLSHPV